MAEFCDIGSKLGGAKTKSSIFDHMRYCKSSVACTMPGKYCMFLHLVRLYFQRRHAYLRFLLLFSHNGPWFCKAALLSGSQFMRLDDLISISVIVLYYVSVNLWFLCSPYTGTSISCLTSQLVDHPLSAVRDCLFSIFWATLHVWRPSSPSVICNICS
jgi:hypothetical protein